MLTASFDVNFLLSKLSADNGCLDEEAFFAQTLLLCVGSGGFKHGLDNLATLAVLRTSRRNCIVNVPSPNKVADSHEFIGAVFLIGLAGMNHFVFDFFDSIRVEYFVGVLLLKNCELGLK